MTLKQKSMYTDKPATEALKRWQQRILAMPARISSASSSSTSSRHLPQSLSSWKFSPRPRSGKTTYKKERKRGFYSLVPSTVSSTDVVAADSVTCSQSGCLILSQSPLGGKIGPNIFDRANSAGSKDSKHGMRGLVRSCAFYKDLYRMIQPDTKFIASSQHSLESDDSMPHHGCGEDTGFLPNTMTYSTKKTDGSTSAATSIVTSLVKDMSESTLFDSHIFESHHAADPCDASHRLV